eukprot:1424035-Rhodomonas_salina.1
MPFASPTSKLFNCSTFPLSTFDVSAPHSRVDQQLSALTLKSHVSRSRAHPRAQTDVSRVRVGPSSRAPAAGATRWCASASSLWRAPRSQRPPQLVAQRQRQPHSHEERAPRRVTRAMGHVIRSRAMRSCTRRQQARRSGRGAGVVWVARGDG